MNAKASEGLDIGVSGGGAFEHLRRTTLGSQSDVGDSRFLPLSAHRRPGAWFCHFLTATKLSSSYVALLAAICFARIPRCMRRDHNC